MTHDTVDLRRRIGDAFQSALHPNEHDVYRLLETIHANTLILIQQGNLILQREKTIMTGQDDMKAAIAQLATDIDAEIAALVAAQNNGDDAAFEASAQQLQALSAKLKTSIGPPPAAQPPQA